MKPRLFIVLGFMLFIVALPMASAQKGESDEALTQHYYFISDYLVINYPEAWSMEETEDNVSFNTDETSLIPSWYFPDAFEELGLVEGDVEGAIRYRLSTYDPPVEFDSANMETVVVDDVTLTLYSETFTDDAGDDYTKTLAFRELVDGGYFFGVIFPINEAEAPADELETGLRIVANVSDLYDYDIPEGQHSLAGIYLFDVPDGWSVNVTDDDVMQLTNEVANADLYFLLPQDFELVEQTPSDLTGFLEGTMDFAYDNAQFDPDQVVFETVGDAEIAYYPYNITNDAGSFVGVMVAAELSEQSLIGFDVYSLGEGDISEEDFYTLVDVLTGMTPLVEVMMASS